MRIVETTDFRWRNLPHWEVRGGRYFVTVRCAGTLPRAVREQLVEIERDLVQISPQSKSCAALRRRHFATIEKYLDSETTGILANRRAAEAVACELTSLHECGASVPHFTILPSHWHALIVPMAGQALAPLMKRIKGRSGFAIRRILGDRGPVWQREWFDRWVRDDAEWQRYVEYIRANPVKAGLVADWREHAWTCSAGL